MTSTSHTIFDYKPTADESEIIRAASGGSDADKNIYRASVSSEEPEILQRYDLETDRIVEIERIVMHGPDNIDMSRMGANSPILFNHDRDEYLGAAVSAQVINRRLEVTFRFSERDEAVQIRKDVDSGILRGTSVGAHIFETKIERIQRNGKPALRQYITRWQPYEASVVTVPADTSVGINRAAEDPIEKELSDKSFELIKSLQKENPMTTEPTPKDTPTADPNLKVLPANADDLRKAQLEGSDKVYELVRELQATSELCGTQLPHNIVRNLEKKAIEEKMSIRQYMDTLTKAIAELPDEDKNPLSKLDMEKGQEQEYSLSNLVRGIATGKHEGIEFEAALAIQKAKGQDGYAERGGNPSFAIPWDVLCSPRRGMDTARIRREISTGNAGELVGTYHDAMSFIDTLRDRSIILGSGARILTGLVGSTDIPQKDDNAAFAWIAEGADSGETDTTYSTKELRIHTASGSVGFTRRMRQQSTPGIEGIIFNDLIDGAALLIDTAAIAGTGANEQPRGILNTDGINTITWTAADGITWSTVNDFEKALADDNALMNNPAFILTPTFYHSMKTKQRDPGSGLFLISDNGMLNGYRVFRKTGDLGDNILFADFSQLLLGFWEMLELSRDTSTKAASGGTLIRAFIDMDVNVRHAVSFCKGSQA